MDNLLPKSPRLALLVYTICFLSLNPIIKGFTPDIDCPNATDVPYFTYAPFSEYQTNLNTLLSVLSSNSNASNGFYNSTAGSSPPDIAYGLFMCRGDVSAAECQDCVVSASRTIIEQCPDSKRATIWRDQCVIRYSNESFFSSPDKRPRILAEPAEQNVTHAAEVVGKVVDEIATRAASDDSGKKFATAEIKYSPLEPVYALAQCTPDLSDSDCNDCLRYFISKIRTCCYGSLIVFIQSQSCYLQYSNVEPFYNIRAPPPPPSPVLPPPHTTPSSLGNGRISSQVIIAIIVPIGVAIMLFIASFCFLTRRAKKKKSNSLREDTSSDDVSTLFLQYDFGTIQAGTNNFSHNNKIGEGSFGSVSKCLLPDGREVAVKRLSRTSEQGALEFENEVVLVAKLQHKSLVRLLGFCTEGEERILIYEFLPNKSLDYYLFDQQEQAKLDWSRRYKIIRGVAQGMLYLHEDSQLKIIHRDLKASNILLDDNMNAKISDFGLARIFGVDQTHGNTSQVVGTSGYMSPEYAIHGQFSTKSDVFSFGVLILEIISGRKNNDFYQSDGDVDLLTYAWELWRGGMPFDLVDPTLVGSYLENEVATCVHIALLCVQDDPDARPSMQMVICMLNDYSTLPIPRNPALFARSTTHRELDRSRSRSIAWSVNNVSITELEPR